MYEEAAMRAMRALWHYKSNIGLVGNHVDVSNGKWTATDAGIGTVIQKSKIQYRKICIGTKSKHFKKIEFKIKRYFYEILSVIHLFILEKCPYVGGWVVQKSLKIPLRNIKISTAILAKYET